MSYWTDMYGTKDASFVQGLIEGLKTFAVWKDGKQYVGISQIPLDEVIAEIERNFYENPS